MSTRIFVGNLAAGITRSDLFQLFRKHGGLHSLFRSPSIRLSVTVKNSHWSR